MDDCICKFEKFVEEVVMKYCKRSLKNERPT